MGLPDDSVRTALVLFQLPRPTTLFFFVDLPVSVEMFGQAKESKRSVERDTKGKEVGGEKEEKSSGAER